MHKEKIELIKESFDGLGPKLGVAYSNKEIVDGCIELQGTLARDFASRMQVDIDRDRDVLLAIENIMAKNNLENTEEFRRLKTNITGLGRTIGGFIKGMNGEKIAKRALKLISFDKDVKVLFNIALADEDAQAEYDAIVIAPYGIFVVEVKNWAASMVINERGIIQREDGTDITYDLPGRMSIKEGLLREYLGDLFTTDYQGIVLFSSERAKVQDEYKKIPLSFGGSIVYDIRAYGKDKSCMSREQIDKIVETLLANNKEQKTISKVDSQAIVDDYAKLIVMLEKEPEKMAESEVEKTVETFSYSMAETDAEEKCPAKKEEPQCGRPSQRADDGNACIPKSRYERWRVVSAVSFIIATGIGALAARKVWRV